MTYTSKMRNDYAALIIMARTWREAYRTLRAAGWDRKAACELANLKVTMG